jgi:hypothetical protein
MVLIMARPWPHPVTGIFWFRMAVPLKLRPLVNKREEKCSLQTRDPEEAKIRHALKAAEVRRRWSGLKEGPRSLSQKDAIALAGKFYREMVARHEENPGPERRWERQWRQGGMEVRRAPRPWPTHRTLVGRFLTRRTGARQGQL